MHLNAQLPRSNKLLQVLGAADYSRLLPHLELVTLMKGEMLSQHDQNVEYCYFPISGVASIIVQSPKNKSSEVGLVGLEGFAPIVPVLQARFSPFDTLMQIEGQALRVSADVLRELFEQCKGLREVLGAYVNIFLVQAAFTSLSNANHSVEERLARWILMCHDRTGSESMTLTHEFLAIMLAVRRPSVTLALHELEGRRLVISKRGLIIIRDRAALELFAADTYGRPEEEYRGLIGEFRASRVDPEALLAVAEGH
ncbi:Crp/Fnr family transcriptional regulator [Oryzifoliimicrobium ureilyticus]|uniref:Crp/Fnr family transcriptional regulator n=1 Tax=Oryzifoliimicrobium ureilyticus TaxID=3113724 RepID=UPI0030763A4B